MESSGKSAFRTFSPWVFFLMLVAAISQIKIDFGLLIILLFLGFLAVVGMFYGRVAVAFFNIVVRGE